MKSTSNKSLRILQVIVFALIYLSQQRVGSSHRKCFPCKEVCICTCCVTKCGSEMVHCHIIAGIIYCTCFSLVAGSCCLNYV